MSGRSHLFVFRRGKRAGSEPSVGPEGFEPPTKGL